MGVGVQEKGEKENKSEILQELMIIICYEFRGMIYKIF